MRIIIQKSVHIFIFFTWINAFTAKAQLLQDPVTYAKIKKGVDHIYNFEFAEAESVYNYLKSRYPNHSVPYLFKGMIIYWQYFPITPDSPYSKAFVRILEKSYELAEQRFKEDKDDAENLLSGLGAVGLLLLYYADNGLSRNVLSLAPQTYKFVMRSFEFTGAYYDFYFFTGLYNYYREAYPEAHPVYRPVVIFFPHGDKKLGLQQLRLASDSSLFLKAESNAFLAGIYQSFELNPPEACIYSKKLADSYHNNAEFRADYIRDLLISKNYTRAEKLLEDMPNPSYSNYLQAQIDILKAIIFEKKYKNDTKAEKLYWSGIKKAEVYKDFGHEYSAYAYFGLSRISERANELKLMKKYRKTGLDMASYKHVNFDD
ncbi:MAG TPA: hypothetical protein VJ346_10695 [Bacteroidales bacterium]|nr:hypothetical protein [Bacteroidales bacterium]